MFPLTRKIFKDPAREKTFVSALILQLILIFSISILLSYTVLYFNPDVALQGNVRIGYNIDSPLIKMLSSNPKISLVQINDNYISYFNNSIIDIYIYEKKEHNTTLIDIYIPDNKAKEMMYLGLLKEPLKKYSTLLELNSSNNYKIPLGLISLNGEYMEGSDVTFEILFGYLIPFILLIPIYLIGTLIIDIITEDYEKKTIYLLLSSMSKYRYVFEVVLAGISLFILQDIFWVLIMSLKGIILNNLMLLFVYLIILSIFMLSISVFIAFLFKNKSKAQLIYSLIVVFITSLTNVVFFSPVNSIVDITLGIESINMLSFAIPLLLSVVLFYIVSRISTE